MNENKQLTNGRSLQDNYNRSVIMGPPKDNLKYFKYNNKIFYL